MSEKASELPPISPSTIESLRRADPNGGRCIITNEPFDVEVAHLLNRNYAKDDSMLSALEWVWLMQRGSLHVDTRSNLCFMKKSLHKLFRKGGWILLPTVEIVNMYLKEPISSMPLKPPSSVASSVQFSIPKARGSLPDLQDEFYTYELYPIPCKEMRATTIHRHGDDGSVESYPYPFVNFPKIKSHIHPRYVILAASRGLGQMSVSLTAELDRGVAAGRLMKIQHVFRSWRVHAIQIPGIARLDPVFMGLGKTDGGRCEDNRDQKDKNEEEEDDGYATDDGRLLLTPPLSAMQCEELEE
ncbi:hypothetical protein CVT24_008540 [Panaeolus cyanescens]|uniref:HNH nuclease domain-containing protein n=1 Tax=Panaeolus cyanescens TaxID=181874 RepID=A0A409VL35_9AGAR|nr:hypothetical protein CVT24_008540 [Panaeolus cyanescens]